MCSRGERQSTAEVHTNQVRAKVRLRTDRDFSPLHHVTIREAEVERDKKVSEAKRLLERASTYKEEAKREHEKVRPWGLMGSYWETCSR